MTVMMVVIDLNTASLLQHSEQCVNSLSTVTVCVTNHVIRHVRQWTLWTADSVRNTRSTVETMTI